MEIRYVVFDMGDVLYDATLWRRWLVRVVRQLGFDVHYPGFFEDWDGRYLPDVHLGRRAYREAFGGFLLDRGLSPPQTRPFPGVFHTLEQLGRGRRVMGVLSNSELTGAELREKLGVLGLGHFFTTVASSFDLGFRKPDPAAYYGILEQMGAEPDESIFVGHALDELVGAAGVGMHTLAFNYGPDTLADYHAHHFSDIANIILRTLPVAT
jgi:HAD superfamily hydrolase (TIGR01509 family)